ncbi:hypothetical protein HYU13_04150 [Candidatus Woesearchaeota archaeon]|nr:hypothetical protein [Candidatus Woesearchaeota archaeon]
MVEPKELSHYYLFSYSLASLQQKAKVKVIRHLLGYKNKKGKLYEHKGIVQEHDAVKIAQNVLLVPAEQGVYFSQFFAQNKIPYELKEVWMKR